MICVVAASAIVADAISGTSGLMSADMATEEAVAQSGIGSKGDFPGPLFLAVAPVNEIHVVLAFDQPDQELPLFIDAPAVAINPASRPVASILCFTRILLLSSAG